MRSFWHWLLGEDEMGMDLGKDASPGFIIILIASVIIAAIVIIKFNF